MKNLRYISLLTLACVFISNICIAQQSAVEENPFKSDGTIESLFNYTFEKASNYKSYKVIDKAQFLLLQQNALDSLSLYKKEIKKQEIAVHKLTDALATASNNIKMTSEKLEKVINSKDSITVFDIELEKNTYHSIVMSTLLLLLLLVAFYIYKFFKSNILTKEAKTQVDELQSELENAQKSALNRYQVLNRKYQDEVMKNRKE